HASQIPIVPPPPSIPAPIVPTSRPLSIGFYINWDESSYESLKRNLDHLDWVIGEWSHLQDATTGTSPLVTEMQADATLMAVNYIRETRPEVRILPMVQNLQDEKWNSGVLARSIADEPHRRLLISSITAFVEENKFSGVCIDFEEPTKESLPN